jgi:hypothetical protein
MSQYFNEEVHKAKRSQLNSPFVEKTIKFSNIVTHKKSHNVSNKRYTTFYLLAMEQLQVRRHKLAYFVTLARD